MTFDAPDDEREEPCILTPKDDPSMLDPPTEHPVGPRWWEGRWPHAGISSLADLELWVNQRLEEAISMRWSSPNTLGGIALSIGRQAVENTTRYLARSGSGNHPPRPKEDQLQEFADVQDALEVLLRHIKQERMTIAGASNDSPAHTSTATTPAASGDLDGEETATLVEQAPDPETFIIDQGTFSVHWRGKTCKLDNTTGFRLLIRLARRPGHYVSLNGLIDSVWAGKEVDNNTVQKTAGNPRRKLEEAGMGNIIGSQRHHYTLELPKGILASIVSDGASDRS